jgi:nicotinamide-nucleotide amidase
MRLEEKVGALLLGQSLTLATAESCTGGLLGHRLTNVPGSSAYYLGGVVAYSYEAKERLLGVRHETLVAHGAVSEETAREMARGARDRLQADVAVALTGIAGPGGGMPNKPVGLVHIALAAAEVEIDERHVWQGTRLANKRQSAEAALEMLLSFLMGRETVRPRVRPAIEFLDEPVGVDLHLRRDGTAIPLGFVWRSRPYRIESWGREREEERDGCTLHCYLVQTAGLETWELCQDKETAQWHLVRHWAARHQAV